MTDEHDNHDELEEGRAKFDKEIYDRITEVFTDRGFKYRDSPNGYDRLTMARSWMEGALPGIATKEHFVRILVEVIENIVDDMNGTEARNDGK